MARPIVNNGLRKLITPVMFGRSNSLSINTGAANSTLYAPSPHSSSVSFPPSSPELREHPTQGHRRPDPPEPSNRILKAVYEDDIEERDASNAEAPWLNPNWTPPSGPPQPVLTAELQEEAKDLWMGRKPFT